MTNSSIYQSRKKGRGRCPDGAPNPIDVYVGKRVRLRRQLLGFNQIQMAEMLGITFQQVQKYEKGSNRLSASRLWDISRIFQTDISYFFQEIPQEIADQSPRLLWHGEPETDKLPQIQPEYTNEAQELLINYFHINNPQIKQNIFQLIKNLAHPNS